MLEKGMETEQIVNLIELTKEATTELAEENR
jgi:hypothetical protein